MRKHTHIVQFTLPERPLGKSPLQFEVYLGAKRKVGSKFGTLRISNGRLVWKEKTKQYKVSWEGFARFAKMNTRNNSR
jgi:hypothetical protein